MPVTAQLGGGRRVQSQILRTHVQRHGVMTVARFTVLKVVSDEKPRRATYQSDEHGRTTLRLGSR